MADEATNGAAGAEATTPAQFNVQKIYLKNVSFEAPNAPAVFQEQAQPQLQLNLNQKVGRFEADMYEVVLSITLTCTINEKTAYLAEVEQALPLVQAAAVVLAVTFVWHARRAFRVLGTGFAVRRLPPFRHAGVEPGRPGACGALHGRKIGPHRVAD